jgi:hypothetical protein
MCAVTFHVSPLFCSRYTMPSRASQFKWDQDGCPSNFLLSSRLQVRRQCSFDHVRFDFSFRFCSLVQCAHRSFGSWFPFCPCVPSPCDRIPPAGKRKKTSGVMEFVTRRFKYGCRCPRISCLQKISQQAKASPFASPGRFVTSPALQSSATITG